MHRLKGKRIILAGLISSKENVVEFLAPIRARIIACSGEIVAELIQRRGVSRANTTGGSNQLDKPLSPRTYLGTGKVVELKELVVESNADLVIIFNDLNHGQLKRIEDIIGISIELFQK